MTSEQEKAPARGRKTGPARWKRIALAFCAGVALVLLLAALGYAFRVRLLHALANARIPEGLGTFAVEGVEGNLLSGVRLQRLSWRASDPSFPLQRLEAAELEARYSLWRLLRGGLEGLESVSARDLLVRVELGHERERKRKEWQWPERLPELRCTGAEVEVALANATRIRGEGLSLEAGGSAFELEGDALAVRHPRWGERAGALSIQGDYQAGRFEVRSLELDGAQVLHDSTVALADVWKGEVDFALRLALFRGEGSIEGRLRERVLECAYELTELEAEEAVRFARPDWPVPPRAVVSAQGRLRYPLPAVGAPREPSAQPAFELTADLAARAILFDGRTFESLEAELALTRDALHVSRLVLRQGANRFEAREAQVALGSADPWTILRNSRGEIELDWTDVPAMIAGSEAFAAGVPPHRVHIGALLREDRAELRSVELETAGGHLTVQRGQVLWAAGPDARAGDTQLDLDVELAFDDLASVGALWGASDWRGSLHGSAHVAGTLRSPTGSFDLRGSGVVVAGRALGELELVARADSERIEFARSTARGALGELQFSGGLRVSDLELDSMQLFFQSSALQQILPEDFESGSVRIDAQASGPWRTPRASFQLQASDLSFRGRPLELFFAQGTAEGGEIVVEQLHARLERIEIDGRGALTHQAWRPPFVARVDELRARRDELDLALLEPARVELDRGRVQIDSLRCAGTAGVLSGELSLSGEELRLKARAEDLRAMQLLGPFLPEGLFLEGVLGELSLERTPTSLSVDGALEIERMRFRDFQPEASLHARLRFAEGRLAVEEFVLDAPARMSLAMHGWAPFDPFGPELLPEGEVSVHGDFDLADLSDVPWRTLGVQTDWRGRARSRFSLGGSWSALAGDLELDASLELAGQETLWRSAQLDVLEIAGRARLGEGLRLEALRVEAVDRAVLEASGLIGLPADVHAWIGGSFPAWRSAAVSLQGRLSARDLSFLTVLTPDLRRVGGSLEGELAMEGTLSDPRWSGSLALHDGELRTNTLVPAVELLEGELAFDSNRILVRRLSGEFGAAPFQVEGSIALREGRPELDLSVRGEQILLARVSGLRLRADADLKVQGPYDALRWTGLLDLRESRYTRDFDFLGAGRGRGPRASRKIQLFSLRRPPWSGMEFDVAVTASEPFVVDNNLARGDLRPDLRLAGTGASPELVGTVFVDPTRVKLPACILRVSSGTLTFESADPNVPQLDLHAETRVRGYDITVAISGPPDDPTVLMTSVPPLSHEELVVLVFTGQLPQQALSQQGGAQTAQTVAVFLGQDLITSWFGTDSEGDESVLERLEVQRGTDVSKAGVETTQVSLRLSGDERLDKRTIYLRAEKDVYERINFGLKFLFRID